MNHRGIFLFTLLFNAFINISFAQEKVVNIVTEAWEPYMGPNLQDNGFLAAITVAAFKEAGYRANISFYPWARALNLVRSGKADGLLGAFYSDERATFLLYSDYLATQETAVFSLKERNIKIKKIEDLEKYTIGIVQDALHSIEFDTSTRIKKTETIDIDHCIKLLLLRRIDMFAGPKENVAYIINKNHSKYSDEIVEVGPPLSIQKIYCGISKNIPNSLELLTALNSGLKTIRNNGTLNKIAQIHGYK